MEHERNEDVQDGGVIPVLGVRHGRSAPARPKPACSESSFCIPLFSAEREHEQPMRCSRPLINDHSHLLDKGRFRQISRDSSLA
jgi:hypothetical protein